MRMRWVIALILAAVPAFPATWSGYLVDSNCYGSELRNVSLNDANPLVSSDMGWDVRHCAVTNKTRHFAVVDQEWNRLKLDPAGDERAAGLVRNAGKRRYLRVNVTGDKYKHTIAVKSISVANAAPAR
jgi:hypothetical protein